MERVGTDVDILWDEFKRDASRDARDRLILHYSPLVKYVASRVAVGLPHNVDQADLEQEGERLLTFLTSPETTRHLSVTVAP